jgi:hypothetical protein
MPSPNPAARERELHRPGGQLNPVPSFTGKLPQALKHTRVRPTTAGWGLDAPKLPKYQSLLVATGLEDPTEASARNQRARALMDESRAVTAGDPRHELGDQLASGAIAAADVRRALAKRTSREDELRVAKEVRVAFEVGARGALLAAMQSIHDYGEEAWLARLRPIAADAIARGDDARFDAVHRLAAFLRDPVHTRIFGLAALVDPARFDVDRQLYAFADPRAVMLWRLTKAEPSQIREQARYVDESGAWCAVLAFKRDAPQPKISDFDLVWGAGLYSAAEVLEHVARIRAQERRELEALAPAPEPATRKPAARRAVTA